MDMTPSFDFVIHVRTLALIEDMTTEDGRPLAAKAQSDAYVSSQSFENMVRHQYHTPSRQYLLYLLLSRSSIHTSLANLSRHAFRFNVSPKESLMTSKV